MNRLRRLSLAALVATPAWAAERVVTYPAQEMGNRANRYPLRLLEEALTRSSTHYKLQPVQRMQQGRALAEVGSAHSLDIIWAGTSFAREHALLPVRIPIYKGMLGWRLLLIRKDDVERFAGLKPEDLRTLRCVSGHDWPDTDVLQANHMAVTPVAGNEAMFRLLEEGRIDFFPRSSIEIWDEAETHPKLMVEPHLAIAYPLPSYFFVNRNGEKLAADLHEGLERMVKDGSFERLFLDTFGDTRKLVHMKDRQILHLKNPLLPPATPLNRHELWD